MLQSLGVPNDQLQNVRPFRGVKWILGSETCLCRSAIFRHGIGEVQQSSMHRLHFHNKAQAKYQDVHVKGLLTRLGFVTWGREPRSRSLWAINSLCKLFLLPSRPTNNKKTLFSVFAPTVPCKAHFQNLLQPVPQTRLKHTKRSETVKQNAKTG